ncbi:MAG TPA: cation transporter, partial [Methylophilus sp.]|nr:cation transporter [Methylophilus sp.]
MKDTDHGLDIAISGMSCASCVTAVENALRKVPAVQSAEVNLATEKAHVELKEGVPYQAEVLLNAVVDAGYGAKLLTHHAEDNHHEESSAQGIKIVFATLLSLPLIIPMLLSLAGVHWNLPGWVQWLLATPVQFYLGAGFYTSAWKAIKNKTGNMDLLVAIGTSAAYLLSIYMMTQG